MEVSIAKDADTADLASCLAMSYRDNPLFGWMFDGELDHALLRGIFTGLLEAALPQNCVYKAPNNLGAAIWQRPRTETPATDAQPDPARDLRTSAGRRTAALAVLQQHRPATPHLYLAAVGVLPAERRRGLATALLGPVLEKSDAAEVDAYLENSDPKNTSLYEGLGFRSVGSLPMPLGCPPVVGMIRKAASRSAN